MTVHFVGAGPGAADLLTLRGRDILARCPVCLYAGSLIPREMLGHCPPGARLVDTAPLTLDEIGVGADEVGLATAVSKVQNSTPKPPKAAGEKLTDEGDGGAKIAEYLVAQKIV